MLQPPYKTDGTFLQSLAYNDHVTHQAYSWIFIQEKRQLIFAQKLHKRCSISIHDHPMWR